MFDPVTAVLALKADELKALLTRNPGIVRYVSERDVMGARWDAAAERAEAAFDAYRAASEAQVGAKTPRARLRAIAAVDAAFEKYRRASASAMRRWRELDSAFKGGQP